MMPQRNPMPEVGQWWRFEREEGRVKRVLPGGGGGLGICEFDGLIPAAHVSTMLRFSCWSHLPNGPTARALPPPCTCVTLDGGVVIADGCAMHSADGAKEASATPWIGAANEGKGKEAGRQRLP